MSVLASTWAWQQQIPPNWKLVLVALADHAHDDGAGAYPSKALLAAKTGYSERQIQRVLGQLVEAGVTTVVRFATKHRATEYALMIEDTFSVRRDKWGDNLSPLEGVSDVSPGETSETGEGVSDVSLTVSRTITEPSTTSSSPAVPATMLDQAFDAFWKNYPRKVGKATARKAFLKALRSVPVAEIIDGAFRLANDPNLPGTEFIPHPTTWLNRGGWEDAPFPERERTKADEQDAIYAGPAAAARLRMAEREAKILAERATQAS